MKMFNSNYNQNLLQIKRVKIINNYNQETMQITLNNLNRHKIIIQKIIKIHTKLKLCKIKIKCILTI